MEERVPLPLVRFLRKHIGGKQSVMSGSIRTVRSAPLTLLLVDDPAPSVAVMLGEGPAMKKFNLRPDESLTVGTCGCARCANGLLLPTRIGLGFQARLTAQSHSWTATNMSPDIDLWCVDLEDDAQRIRVAPGRAEMFVPFEFTGVEFRLHDIRLAPVLRVVAHEPVTTRCENMCLVTPHANRVRSLRRGTAYMAVLEELVAGTAPCGAPPSSEEISARLGYRGMRVSRKAVDKHIDYLGDRLLPDDDPSAHKGWKRVALAAIARRARLIDVHEAGT